MDVESRSQGTVAEDPVSSGLQLATARLARYGIEFPLEQVSPTIDLALSVLRQQQGEEELSGPGIELYVETVAVSAAARQMAGEAELTKVDLVAYMGIGRWFYNSLWHVRW